MSKRANEIVMFRCRRCVSGGEKKTRRRKARKSEGKVCCNTHVPHVSTGPCKLIRLGFPVFPVAVLSQFCTGWAGGQLIPDPNIGSGCRRS
jgi:hypothetical protein